MKRIAAYCLGLLVAGPALATQTTTYVALVDGGKNAGHQVVTRDDDGTTHVDFIVKDNGRGPELKETYSLAPDGTFSRYAVKGTSTFGAAGAPPSTGPWRSGTSGASGAPFAGGMSPGHIFESIANQRSIPAGIFTCARA